MPSRRPGFPCELHSASWGASGVLKQAFVHLQLQHRNTADCSGGCMLVQLRLTAHAPGERKVFGRPDAFALPRVAGVLRHSAP